MSYPTSAAYLPVEEDTGIFDNVLGMSALGALGGAGGQMLLNRRRNAINPRLNSAQAMATQLTDLATSRQSLANNTYRIPHSWGWGKWQ